MKWVENPMVIDSLWRKRTINDEYFSDVIDMDDFEECRCCSCDELLERERKVLPTNREKAYIGQCRLLHGHIKIFNRQILS